MAQYSNNSITAYEGLDVLHPNFNNSAVVVECHKDKCSCDDCDGPGPSGQGSSNDITYRKGQKGSQNLWPLVTVTVRRQVIVISDFEFCHWNVNQLYYLLCL